jgi:intein/homing endonuclease
MPYIPAGLDIPKNIDWDNKTYISNTEWSWIKEGDDSLLSTNFNGFVWKYDKSRGLIRETLIEDYAVKFLKSKTEWEPNAEWTATTTSLGIDEHIDTMAIMSKYIDSAMSKCIVEGTLITTDIGIVPIESLSDNKIEDSFSDTNVEYKILDMNGDLKKITKHYNGGEKDCYNITFDNGFNIECAYTHKFNTENGWYSVTDLKVNDSVYFRKNGTLNNNEYIKIEDQPDFTNCIKRTMPEFMNEDYAKFIGMLLSDGSINDNSISICEKNDLVKDEVIRLFDVLFDEKINIQIDNRSGVRTHILNSRSLSKYFKNMLGENALTKKIPDVILRSNDSVKKAFIEGLSLDGYIDSSNNLVVYCGYSKDIQLKTSYILSSLGYQYYIGSKKVANGRLSKVAYLVKAYLTDNTIQPTEYHKIKYSISGKRQNKALVNDNYNYQNLPKTSDSRYYLLRNLKRSLQKTKLIRRELLDKLNIEYDSDLTCVKVKSIEYIGKKKVYDIEVEDTHSYLINGIVSHNTINLPNEYSYDEFKELYTKLYDTKTVKGGTTYRLGTMTSVLSSVDKKDNKTDNNALIKTQAPKRPVTLDCDIHQLTVMGDKWIVIIGLFGDNRDPYEVFAFKKKDINISDKIKVGTLTKIKRGRYDLDLGGIIIENIKNNFESGAEEALTRMISTSLRHGADINFIYQQLQKSEGTISSFSKAIARTLKKYLNDEKFDILDCAECGGKGTVVMQEGCYVCKNCGASKCG